MKKGKVRPEWWGHADTVANICGCSKTAVSKILNGRASEVTTNQELIAKVKRTTAGLLQRDSKILVDRAAKKQEVARMLETT